MHTSVLASVRASVHVSETMFLRYLQYLLVDLRQTFVIGASWDKDQLVTFWGCHKVLGQGHIIVGEASRPDAAVEVRFLVKGQLS